MRLPVDDEIALSCLVPTLRDHGEFQSVSSTAVAAGHLRSYQRARRRSFHTRGIKVDPQECWDEIHYPFDPISYHLICHERGMFSCAQQSRFFYRHQFDVHERVLTMMCRHGMLEPSDIPVINSAIDQAGCSPIAQIGGWVARCSAPQRRAAFMPYYSWALNRLFKVRFAYAPCRVDNGAARFLLRMGAFPLSEPTYSSFYGGSVQILGFTNDAKPRHEPLIHEAAERLCDAKSIFLGTHRMEDPRHTHLMSTRVRPGGALCYCTSATRERVARVS